MRRVWLVTDDGEEGEPVWLGEIPIAEDALVEGSVSEGSGQSLKEMAHEAELTFRADTSWFRKLSYSWIYTRSCSPRSKILTVELLPMPKISKELKGIHQPGS
jgi:hypothetical protein